MADSTDEEHLDKSRKTQSEIPSDEIIHTKNTQTINPNQETENMEVHHHPDLHHKSKHFREYFLEFLMIFLAVTMGFFAENIRENIADNAKANEYANSLYGDLKKDSSRIDGILNIKTWRRSKIDSLISILKSADVNKNQKMVYYFHSFLGANLPFTPNDATIQQLRNTGAFRYFKNPELYRLITLYYSDCSFYYEREKEISVKIPVEFVSRLFQSDILISEVNIVPDVMKSISMPPGNPELLTLNKQVLNEYLLYAGSERGANNISIFLLQDIIEKEMKDVMRALQKQYDIH